VTIHSGEGAGGERHDRRAAEVPAQRGEEQQESAQQEEVQRGRVDLVPREQRAVEDLVEESQQERRL